MDNTQTKRYVIIALVFFISGVAISGIIDYGTERNTEAFMQYRMDLTNSCYQGCYNDIMLVLYEDESVESVNAPGGAFSGMFDKCKMLCWQQYGP